MNPSKCGVGPFDYANPRLEPHMIFICPECGMEHDSQQEWRRHLNEDHDYIHKTFQDFDFKEINERYHECLVCRRWVANAHQAIALLQYHRFLHLPHSRTYRCRHCSGAFTRKRALCEHLYRLHSRLLARIEKQQPQPKQHPKQTQRRNLGIASVPSSAALRNPEFYLRFLCPQCCKQFDRFEEWTHHIDTAHTSTSTDLRMHRIAGSRNHYCLQCKKLIYTSDKARLQRHRFMHLPHKAYFKCAHCNTRKTFKTEILRHYIFAHAVEFERSKAHIRLPVEWAGQASDRLRKELEQLLVPSDVEENKGGGSSTGSGEEPAPQSTDLIQKALLDSLIDLENETIAAGTSVIGGTAHKQPCVAAASTTTTLRSASEYALDQSLNDLEAILRGDMETTTSHQKSLIQNDAAANGAFNSRDSNHELDELCAAFFEAEEREMRAPTMPLPVAVAVDVKMEEIKDEIDAEPEEEEECVAADLKDIVTFAEEAAEHIVSIEIDALAENVDQFVVSAADAIVAQESNSVSPKRKRRKLSDSVGAGNCTKKGEAAVAAPVIKNEKSLLDAHINYLCPECGSEFAEQPAWRQHVFSAHNLANALETSFKLLENKCSYLCLDCMQVQHTMRHSDLQRHRFMHMPFQAYLKCMLCKKTKSSKPKMLQHLQSYHAHLLNGASASTAKNVTERASFKCAHCFKEFAQQSRWLNHRAQCDKRPPRQQSIDQSKSASRINEHMRLVAHLKQARARMRLLQQVEHVDS